MHETDEQYVRRRALELNLDPDVAVEKFNKLVALMKRNGFLKGECDATDRRAED